MDFILRVLLSDLRIGDGGVGTICKKPHLGDFAGTLRMDPGLRHRDMSPYAAGVLLLCDNRVETRRAGRALGRVVLPGSVIGFEGELGAGKTFFVRALARGLGVPREVAVTSPTFTIVHVVPGGRLPLHHVDLYRLDREADIAELGLDEMLHGRGVTAIEWWPRLGAARPPDALVVRIDVRGARERVLDVAATGKIAEEVCCKWLEALGRPGLC